MKKQIFVGFFLGMIFMLQSCIKDTTCTEKTVESQKAAILDYAAANGINAVQLNTSGLYYEITDPGTGATPTLASTISAKYTGKLLDGSTFDATTTTPATFPLSGVIAGWQLGIPLIKKGGKIKLIIPSALAYGCQGRSTIPSNAILYFDVELTDVQ